MLDKKFTLPSNKNFYLLLFFFKTLCFSVLTLKFHNIIDFYIEDYYNLPLSQSIFSLFSEKTYASNISWQLVTAVIFLILQYMESLLLRDNPAYFELKGRQKTLSTLLVIGLVITVLYIVSVLYSYFSGHTEPYGLLRVGVALALIAVNLIYFYYERNKAATIKGIPYKATWGTFIGISLVMSMMMLHQFAAPADMRLARQDAQVSVYLNHLPYEINRYFEQKQVLPMSLEELSEYALNKKSTAYQQQKDKITYNVLSTTKFELCGHFSTDSRTARRFWPSDTYAKGENCRKYALIEMPEMKGHFKVDLMVNPVK